jgi:hypothetical protein
MLIDRFSLDGRITGKLSGECLVAIPPLLSELVPVLGGHIRCFESDLGRYSSRSERGMSLGFKLAYDSTSPVDAGTENIEEKNTGGGRYDHCDTSV